jgi:hypothetical protein
VFDFVHFESFPITGGFLRAENKKNEAVLGEFFEMVNSYEIFYVMKVVGKILWGISLIGRIVNFYLHQVLEFSDSRFGSYQRFSGKYVFQRGVPRQILKLIFLVQFIPSRRFVKKNLEKCLYFHYKIQIENAFLFANVLFTRQQTFCKKKIFQNFICQKNFF